MKPLIYAAMLGMISGQAHALSCLRPDPIETFQRLAAAPESYFILYGTLSFDERAVPPLVRDNNSPAPDPIPGRFAGKGLTSDGFTNTYISDVNLQISCAGPWCGSASSGGEAIYFVPASEPPVTLLAGPCGGMIFPDPSDAVLDMLTSCMQGGTCTPVE